MSKARQSEARKFPNRAAAMEASDDAPLSPPDGKTIGDVIAQRYNRRDIVKGAFGVAAATALLGPAALAARESQTGTGTEVFSFEEIAAGANKVTSWVGMFWLRLTTPAGNVTADKDGIWRT